VNGAENLVKPQVAYNNWRVMLNSSHVLAYVGWKCYLLLVIGYSYSLTNNKQLKNK
jgi:hypothetical protein